MAPLYSQLLWRQQLTLPGSLYNSTAVPAGFVWDVRDILFVLLQSPQFPVYGVTIGDGHGGIMGGAWYPEVRPNHLYHQEMRQIMNAGDQLFAKSDDAGWFVRVSGYALTTP